ncbi:putative addiction module component (TIGR02574 family) [Azospirillum fermentarium]|uniref:addiction module protein n=1 Tax=Azospirillum fermentarium TaxID=1233114 RepID=UPI002226B3E6|nr:addiction module protein [Azospirillum fermentarium]MCW2246622.1 putative addiction module component (TIGR02574 family) [Azospirillum fermentarium]
MPSIDFSLLTPRERLDLADDLLGSLSEADVPLSAESKAEIDRRNATFAETRAHAVPWAEVRARLRSGTP